MATIQWKRPTDGWFTRGGNWVGHQVPGRSDLAVLGSLGAPYTVMSQGRVTVEAISLAADVKFSITSGVFSALAGTGPGANAGTIIVNDGASFAVGGTIANWGLISLQSLGDGSILSVSTDATLTGSGVVTMSASAGNRIDAARGARVRLVNHDNTITGSGAIATGAGGGLLTLENDSFGVIDGVGTMSFGPQSGSASLVNYGLIDETSGGFTIRNTAVTGVGGRIVAGWAGHILIINSTLSGQQLIAARGGTVEFNGGPTGFDLNGLLQDAGTFFFNGDAPTVTGDLTLSSGGTLWLNTGATIGGAGPIQINTGKNTLKLGGAMTSDRLRLTIGEAGALVGIGPLASIDVGAGTIINDGRIGGSLVVTSVVENNGVIGGVASRLVFSAAVVGSGKVAMGNASTIVFKSSFTQDLSLNGNAVVELAQSQSYTGQVTNFGDHNRLILDDIAFTGAGEATYSGTASGGVLTVSDGTHTAHFTMVGDYLGHGFVTASNGAGGVVVTWPQGGRLAQAMAAFAPTDAGSVSTPHSVHHEAPPVLANPVGGG